MTDDKQIICCKRCGSKLLSYNEYSKKRYESPVKRCKNARHIIWIQDAMRLLLKGYRQMHFLFGAG